MGALSDVVAAMVIRILGNFCTERNLGWVFGASASYQCFGGPTIRRCDVSFVRSERLSYPPDGTIRIPPDLAVEVVSPGDLAYEVEAKITQYLDNGFSLIWVLYPHTRTLHIHRADRSTTILTEQQQITGEGALNGFACAVRDFFPPQDPSQTPAA